MNHKHVSMCATKIDKIPFDKVPVYLNDRFLQCEGIRPKCLNDRNFIALYVIKHYQPETYLNAKYDAENGYEVILILIDEMIIQNLQKEPSPVWQLDVIALLATKEQVIIEESKIRELW